MAKDIDVKRECMSRSGTVSALDIVHRAEERCDNPAARGCLQNAADSILDIWPARSIRLIRMHVHATDAWHDALGIERPKG